MIKNKNIGIIALHLFIMFLLFASAEVALRKAGHEPWRPKETDIVIEPGGRFIAEDPVLGYKHLPGRFKLSMPYPPYSVSVSNLENNRRITRPLSAYDKPHNKKEIWIFGCSFTHGWLVNDEETYPWRVQEGFPDYEVVNLGVCGYGTLHSLLQLQEALKAGGKPELVILAYASFHDQRNIFCRSRRKELACRKGLDRLFHPYVRFNMNGGLAYCMSDKIYRAPPFIGLSSFIDWLDNQYNKIESYFYQNRKIARLLINKFYRICSESDIKFVVAGIWPDPSTHDMLRYCEKEGIETVDISIKLNRETTYSPHDGHPNALGYKRIATKLTVFLDEFLSDSVETVVYRNQ